MHSLLSLRSSCLMSVAGQVEMKLPVFSAQSFLLNSCGALVEQFQLLFKGRSSSASL